MGGRFCGLRPRPASRRPLTWSIHAGILRHIRGRRDPLAVWAAIVARTKEGLDDLDAKHGDDRRGRRGSAGGAGDLLRAATPGGIGEARGRVADVQHVQLDARIVNHRG